MTKVIVAGGGIGGISAALSLLKAGLDVEVYEQASELMEIGAGIQLSANAMHVLFGHGLRGQLSKLWVKPSAYVFRLHDTGEVVSKIPLAEEHERQHGAPYCQFHRADLLDVMASHLFELKPDAVRLNHRVVGYEEMKGGVKILFEGGSSAVGDILVGADGVKSRIRSQMLGAAKPTYTGDCAWRLIVPSKRLKSHAEHEMAVWMGPGKHAVSYFLRGGELLNFVGLVETDDVSEESWVTKFPWEGLKAEFVGWNEEIQSIIDAADRDECTAGPFSSDPLSTTGAVSALPCWVTQFTQRFHILPKVQQWLLRTVPYLPGALRRRPTFRMPCCFINTTESTAPQGS
jgi:2-polyprenyl-6-methoxyphenol hydroxylase-like FAD-dependent oxidoreductase